MNRIKLILAILGIFLAGSSFAQQNPMYSQYMFNMLNINPAYAGSREVPNFTILMRRQWTDIPGSPTSGSVTYDDRVNDRNHSWGMQMYFDKVGIERTTGVQGFYSYSAPFDGATLSMGLSFGLLNYNVNYNRTDPYDQGDPSLQQSFSKFIPTAGAGALLSGNRWYIGVSSPALFKTRVTSLNQSVISPAGAEGHYFLSAGYVIPVSETVVLKPSTLLKAVSGSPLQADINMNIWLDNKVGFGASYRTQDAVVGMVEFQMNSSLRAGYAYDFGIGDLGPYKGATHELMLRYELGGQQGKKITSPRYF